ncbi:MAG: TonB-dependent receptor [Rhodospirillaceae bacterium]|nr:TonB-dependent receptor [Rhodospirillaceae bacterium]
MNTTTLFASRPRRYRVGLKNTALRTASATAILLATTIGAHAQQLAAAAAAPEVESEIVVTGSRIVRDGYEAPTPVTVVGVEELQSSASANVADYVNTIPAFAGSIMPTNTNSTMSSGRSGLNTPNLRNLGVERTLVLIDGQRSVGSTSDGLVDLNTIPQALISRVDVSTGGASAAYGSDAVAGVINFILDKEFTGFKADIGGSVTTYGDNESWDTSLTYGTPFQGGKGHFIISASASDSAGVKINDRPWNMQGWQILDNPAYGTGAGQSTSVPARLLRNQTSVSNGIAGGIITSCIAPAAACAAGGSTVGNGLVGMAFGDDGRPYPFPYGSIVSNPVMVGGGWRAATIRGTRYANGLTSASETQSVFLRTSYDLADNITVFAQASWTHNGNQNWCCMKEDNDSIVISSDNPFIPAEIAARMTALGVTQFRMGSMHADTRNAGAINDRRVQRYVVGANGTFDAMDTGWTWDAYYQKGISHVHQETFGVIKQSAYAKAINAVRSPVTGQAVCRVNADAITTNDDPTCVPYNPFGIGVNSAEVVDYMHGNGEKDFRTEVPQQDVMAVNFSGSPFETWAGPVSIAFGAEHRIEKIKGTNDPVSRAFDWYFGNYQVFSAKMNVTEGYLETVVPLATDTSFAESLEFNGAVRATDYSTSGYVTTWKAGLTWAPVNDIRFRVTQSRDIRAPNLNNLYSTGTSGFPGYQNPFRPQANGAPTTEIGFSSTRGNPNLVPEKSDMTGVGVVLQPAFLPGFSASVDYWDLNIKGALGSLSVQQIIDQCFLTKSAAFCSAIDFNADNSIALIRTTPFNLVNQIAKGIDFEAGYNMPLDQIVDGADGNLAFRFMGTHFIKRFESNGISVPRDYAGENIGASGVPDWRYRASIGYSNDMFDVQIIARGVSSGVYLNSNVECTTGCPVSTVNNRTVDENDIKGSMWFDTAFTYKFGVGESDMEAYFNVQNVFDKDPAVAAPGPGGFTYEAAPANPLLYDTLGRTFRAGLRLRM